MSRICEIADPAFLFLHSRDETPDQQEFQMHAHPTSEIYYLISGNGQFVVEGNEYPLEPRSVMLMRPGETHRILVDTTAPYERMTLQFNESLIRQVDADGLLMRPFLDRPLGQDNYYAPDQCRSHFIEECFRSLEDMADTGGRALMLQCSLYPILGELGYAFMKRQVTPRIRRTDTISSIISYINVHLCEPLSLEQISSRFFISKAHLNRLFRQAIGSSIWEYILIKRLTLARQQIQSGIHAAEACQNCGFKDYSAFYRSYKKRFGVSPAKDKGSPLPPQE